MANKMHWYAFNCPLFKKGEFVTKNEEEVTCSWCVEGLGNPKKKFERLSGQEENFQDEQGEEFFKRQNA